MKRWRIVYRSNAGMYRELIVIAPSELMAWRTAIGFEDRRYTAIAVEMVSLKKDGVPNLGKGHRVVEEVKSWAQ